jgi:hypothetical protein
MPDISMCDNQTCTLNKTCYRFNANPDEYRQAYSAFKQDEKGNCDYYWPDERLHNNDQKPEECDATGDAKRTES